MIKGNMLSVLFAACMMGLVSCGMSPSQQADINVSSGEIIASADTGIVDLESGKVAGYLENGIYIYKGIPYAKAERFMAPVAPDKWEGIRSSRAYGPTCPQGKRAGWGNDEIAFAFDWDDGYPGQDCLRANVWTPGVNDGKKRPVMVWLHGGGYSTGSGQELPSYDGTNLAKKGDVVVVTLNHRLNVLGFLDLSQFGDKYANSGNVGLLDLVAALQWVNRNIAAFGGDAGNVTIFGQSGGGGKVSTLLATPSAKGLFHKAIVQSGSMLRTMVAEDSRRIGAETVKALGLTKATIDKIKDIPYEQLLAAGESAIATVRKEAEAKGISSFIFGWAPVVDGIILPNQPFDSKAPEISKEIPMLIGTTKHEFTMTTYVPAMRNISKEEAVEILKNKYGERAEEFIAACEKAYPGCLPKDLLDIDVTFRPNAVEQAKIKSAQKGAPVYMYMFAWESPVMDGILRSTHCMEIPFVFNNVVRHASMTGGGSSACVLGDKMSRAWINFAKTGNPNVEGLPTWDVFTPENGALMMFNDVCEMKYNHDQDLMNFIHDFPVRGF